jgi:hypothetical protein
MDMPVLVTQEELVVEVLGLELLGVDLMALRY